MDSERFDTITRTLASGMSRRGVLRTLSAVGAGGVLAVVGRGNVAAKKPVRGTCQTLTILGEAPPLSAGVTTWGGRGSGCFN